MTARPSAAELVRSGTGFLTRSHLRELGLERRAIDGVFRELDVVFWPGYSRPMVRVEDFIALQDRSTYRDDRVRSKDVKRPGGAINAPGPATGG